MFTGAVEAVVLIVVGFLSGAINAVAGGGSLLVFPALLATGMPPLLANVTNSVAQGPGFIGASVSQRADLAGKRRRVIPASVAVVVGSVLGCVLLLTLPAAVFDAVVPALVGLSALLMAFQGRIKQWLTPPHGGPREKPWLLAGGMFLASVYGGYFGGARSVIMIAILVVTVSDTLRRLNALKSWLGLIGSAVTFAVFASVAAVDWLAVLMVAPSTVLGGYVGGKLVRRLPARALRYLVVVIAAGVAIYMLID